MPEDPKSVLRRAVLKRDADAALAAQAAQTTKERERALARARKLREYEDITREAMELGPDDPLPAETEQSQWVRDNMTWERSLGFWEPPHCSYSDYNGGFVEKSNCRTLVRDYPEIFTESGGGHGWTACGITEQKRLALTPEEWESIKDIIEGLEDYPLVNEEDHSELEMEAKEADWEEYGRDGIREALVKKFENDADAQIAVVARRNEFWDSLWTGDGHRDGWDQYMQEETGCNMYFNAKRAAEEVDREDLVDDDLVEATKKALFFKEYAEPLALKLHQANIDFQDNEHLWEMLKYAESVTGPENLWEVDEHYHAEKEELDVNSSISLDLDEVIAVLAEPEAMQKMLHRHWAEDPRQLKLPGLESLAQALVNNLLEAEDPKQAFRAMQNNPWMVVFRCGPRHYLCPLRAGTAEDAAAKCKRTRKDCDQVMSVEPMSAEEVEHYKSLFYEAEDPKSVFQKFSRPDNFWGPQWKQDDSGAWRAQPLSNRIYIIDPYSQGYMLTELWRGAMTGKWREVYRKSFRTPEEVRAHFPARLREAEDPKDFLLNRAPAGVPRRYVGNMPKEIEIWGKRWFSRTYGNTYFTARIYVDGELVHTMPEEYGYGNHYMDRSFEWLEQNGYVPLRPRSVHGNVPDAPWSWCEKHGIRLNYHAEDIRLRRHRFTEAEDPKSILQQLGQQRTQQAQRLRPGARVLIHHRAHDIVDMGQTGVVTALPEPGWAEVELDDPRYSENNYPFRLAELEPI